MSVFSAKVSFPRLTTVVPLSEFFNISAFNLEIKKTAQQPKTAWYNRVARAEDRALLESNLGADPRRGNAIEIYQVDDANDSRTPHLWSGGAITTLAESVQLVILKEQP